MKIEPISLQEAIAAHKITALIFFAFQIGATASHIQTVDSSFQSVGAFLLAFIFAHYLIIRIDISQLHFQCIFLAHVITLLASIVVNFFRYNSFESVGLYFMIGYVCIHLLFFTITAAVLSMQKKVHLIKAAPTNNDSVMVKGKASDCK